MESEEDKNNLRLEDVFDDHDKVVYEELESFIDCYNQVNQ